MDVSGLKSTLAGSGARTRDPLMQGERLLPSFAHMSQDMERVIPVGKRRAASTGAMVEPGLAFTRSLDTGRAEVKEQQLRLRHPAVRCAGLHVLDASSYSLWLFPMSPGCRSAECESNGVLLA
jgi:hypothetical protein